MAAAAVAKAMISMSLARAAASATAARTVPRMLHSTASEVGGAGSAAARTMPRQIHSSSDGPRLSDTEEIILDEEQKRNLEAALFDHKLEMKQLLHEQNMKIIKLHNQFEITKAELEAMKHEIKHEVIKGQTSMLNYVMAFFGVGALATLVFK